MGADPDRNAAARAEGDPEDRTSGAGPASQPSASGAKQRVQIPKPGAAPVVPPPGKPKVPPPSGLARPTSEPGKSPEKAPAGAKARAGDGRGNGKSAATNAPAAQPSASASASASEPSASAKEPSAKKPSANQPGAGKTGAGKTGAGKTGAGKTGAGEPSATASQQGKASKRAEASKPGDAPSAPDAASTRAPSKPGGEVPVAGKMPFAEKPITGSRPKVGASKIGSDGSAAKAKRPPPTPASAKAGQSAESSSKAGAAGTSAAKAGKYAEAVTAAKAATAAKHAKEAAAKDSAAKDSAGKAAETGERAEEVNASDSERPAFDEEGLTLPPPAVSATQEDSSPSSRMRRDPSLVLELDAVDRPVLRDEPDPIATFARFELLGRLAIGGMAEIFLARESLETSASRHTAIKIIRGEFAEDGDFANMFLNEGRLAMRLTHPNICTVYECGRHAGRFFMAMEYVHGQTLREVLVRAAKTKRTMPIPALLKIFAIVAEALDFAHRARDSQGRLLRIVHRDVSPHNVMVRYDGVVKLLDFGVAKAEHSSHATEAGALKGKFSYMSPEQAMAEPIDHRADIFSLGVCIFEAITGRRLFHRKAQYDTLKAILEQDPPELSSFRDDVPDRLEDILKRALSKKPEERYQRAAELQHDLEHLLTEMREVVSTSQIAALMEELFVAEMERGPQLDTAEDIRERFAPELDTAETLPPPNQRLPVWLAAAAGVILVVGGGSWALMSGDGADPTPAADVSGPPAEANLAPTPPPPTDPVETDSLEVGTGEPTSTDDLSAAGEAREGETPNSPTDEGEDATLAASPDGTAPDDGPGEAGGADDRPEEAPSRSTTERRGRGSSTGGRGRSRAGREDRGAQRGGGTVIVTDPGF